jgi:CRISPR-associated protein Cas6
MYWQETKQAERYVVPEDVIDLAFPIRCRTLPVDHAWALAEAVRAVLPWIVDERGAGVHPIHVADSGNGWLRPEGPDDLLCPSRRTRLVLRLPAARAAAAATLIGRKLDIAGHALEVEGRPGVKKLSIITTLFSRYVVVPEGADQEQAFLRQAHGQLAAMGVRPGKMLCGIEHRIATPRGAVRTRSLMLADMSPEESVTLQQQGLGPERLLGCGLFVPHKSIAEVGRPQE